MTTTAAVARRLRRTWARPGVNAATPVGFLVLFAALVDLPERNEQAGLPAALLAAAVSLPLLFRRRRPLLTFLLVSGAVVVVANLNVIPYPCIAAELIAVFALAAHIGRWWISLAAVATFAVVVTIAFPGPLPPIPDTAAPAILIILPWLAGNSIRIRQRRFDSVEVRALRLERERDDAERALRHERTRIAQELHDVIAHTVSVMVIQAGAARQVMHSKPARAAEALGAVEDSGREALRELRHLLGLLSDEPEPLLTPQPGLEWLHLLVDRVRAAGLPVTLRVEGEPRRLSPGVDLAGYRIVQEALTNALKHSGGASTEVVVSYAADEVAIAVVDDGPPSPRPAATVELGSGQGLVGMRERVALYGGTMDAGARVAGGYAVRARLPVGAA